MPGGILTPDDAEFQRWKAAQTPVTHDDAEFQAWKAAHAQGPSIPSAKADASSALPFNRPNPTGDYGPLGRAVVDNVANIATSLPGTLAAASGIRSLIRGQPYKDAYTDLSAAKQRIPAPIRIAENVVGSGPAALIPGSPAMVGAGLAAADQLLDANPDRGVGSRVGGAAIAAPLGYATGKIADAAVTKIRSMNAPTLGRAALDREAATRSADVSAYGQAAREADAVGGTSPAIQQALALPKVAPYVKAVRSADEFAKADDATVLREAYKLMSERQGMLEGRLSNSDFKAGTSLENRDIGAQKGALLAATTRESSAVTPPVVPAANVSIRDASGRLRGDLSQVSAEDLDKEWSRLAELNARENSMHGAVRDAGYREDYEALPRTEKLGVKGREDLPDADGTIDPDVLAADNKVVSDFNKSAIVRRARDQAMKRIEAEHRSRPQDTDFHFGANVEPAAPTVQHYPPAMPSFPAAVQQHATAMGERDAFRQGADVTRRVVKGQGLAAKNLEKKSPEAFLDALPAMTTGQRAAAQQGVLGRLKEANAFARVPGVHVPVPIPTKAYRAVPDLLRNINAPGQQFADLLTKLGISTANSPFANPSP